MWKKRLSLRKRRPSDQIPPHNLNNDHFIYILSRLSSKKRKDRESVEYRSKPSFYLSLIPGQENGKTGLKQKNTNETLFTVTYSGDI